MFGTASLVGAQALTFAIPHRDSSPSSALGLLPARTRTGDPPGRAQRPPAPSAAAVAPRPRHRRLLSAVGPSAGPVRCPGAGGRLVPPVSTEAGRIEAVEAFRFALLAVGIPALVALGAPWRRLGLAGGRTGDRTVEGVAVLTRPGPARHPGRGTAPAPRDAARRRLPRRRPRGRGGLACAGERRRRGRDTAWLRWCEAVSLSPPVSACGSSCVESPPLRPRLNRPGASLAAVAMWTDLDHRLPGGSFPRRGTRPSRTSPVGT